MVQVPNNSMANTQSNSTNSKPHNQKQSGRFQQKTQKRTNGTSNTTGTNGPRQTRNEKRRRWAKNHRVAPKPVIKRGPVKVYVSVCCKLPANKPPAGEKYTAKDPETNKMSEMRRGLGHFRCSGCGKGCKVTVHKPEPKEVPNAKQAVLHQ